MLVMRLCSGPPLPPVRVCWRTASIVCSSTTRRMWSLLSRGHAAVVNTRRNELTAATASASESKSEYRMRMRYASCSRWTDACGAILAGCGLVMVGSRCGFASKASSCDVSSSGSESVTNNRMTVSATFAAARISAAWAGLAVFAACAASRYSGAEAALRWLDI
ncbi:hypothetical protein DFJ73DRAFT_854961 [Zopfochytrium polystomum]|nr:hypothetical protein DFJ73DRAFT_854961 [Zopfochytrium polystomum]